MRRRIVSVAAVLGLLWLVLPVRLARAPNRPSNESCAPTFDVVPAAGADLLPALERCAGLNPTDVELTVDLGSLYESVGRIDDAEAAYRRGLSVEPAHGELRLRLGRLLLKRGDLAGARKEAETALALQPGRKSLLDLRNDATSH